MPIDMQFIYTASYLAACVFFALMLRLAWRPQQRFPFAGRLVALGLVPFVLAWVVPHGLGRVQPGARGVVLRFGAPTGAVKPEVLYYVIPLAETVVQVNTQVNTVQLDRAQATSRDLEPVYADIAVSFHVLPQDVVEVYRSLRFNYAARIVRPVSKEALKEVVAQFAAADLIARRADLRSLYKLALASKLQRFGIALDDVNTTRFNFTYAFSQAAQMKVASVQRTLEAEQELTRVRFEAQQNVIRAESEIKALRLQRTISATQLIRLRELDLQRKAIEKWDGHLPQTTTGVPFFPQALRDPRAD